MGKTNSPTDTYPAQEAGAQLQSIQDQVSLLASVLECTGEMVAVLDHDYRFLYCNQAYKDSLRDVFDAQIHPGLRLGELFAQDDEELHNARELWRRALEGETFTSVREVDVRGETRFYEIHACPALSQEGTCLGAVHAVRDVTIRERSRQQLADSEREFRRMFHESPMGAARVNLEDFTFLEVNRALYEITGYTREELLGKTFMDITHPEDLTHDVNLAGRLQRGEIDHYQIEKRYVRKDGSVVWARLWARLMRDSQGEPLYFLPIIEDVSERKRAEQDLRRQHARLEQMVAERTRELEQSQALHRAVVREFPNGVLLLFDHDLRCLLAGGALAEETAAGFTGETLRQAMEPETADLLEPACRAALDGQTVQLETPWRGEVFDVRISPVHGDDGRILWCMAACQVITERRRMESEMLRSKDQAEARAAELDAALESLAEGVVFYGPDHRIVRMNAAARDILGFDLNALQLLPPEERINLFRILRPDGRPPSVDDLVGRRALNGEVVNSEEMLVVTGLGDVRRILTSAAPMALPDGRVLGAIQSLMDITERHQALEVLQRREQEFRALVENSPDLVVRFDRDHQCLYFNPAVEHLAQTEPIDTLEDACRRLDLDPETVAAQARAIDQAFENGTEAHSQLTLPPAFGGKRLDARYCPEFDDLGRVISVLGVARDVTDLQLALDRADAAVRELIATIESMADGVIIYRPDTSIRRMNSAAFQLLGLRSDQLDQPLDERVPGYEIRDGDGGVPPYDQLPVIRALHGETVRSRRMLLQREGAEDQWLRVSAAPITGEHGETTGAVLSLADVTTAKRLEEELVQAKEEAEEASRAKSEFLANMSHEIRTPLNGMLGMNELAAKRAADPKALDYLRLARQSGEHLLEIINDILDLSRIEAGRFELDPDDFHLEDELSETVAALRIGIKDKPLMLTRTVEQNVPRELHGDWGRLRQVLFNLVGNAVKYTDEGEVHIHVRNEAPPGDTASLHFEVRDTGVGIPENKLDRIFDSFHQERTSAHKKFGGTGLGLTIAREVVSRMGGDIWAESRPGDGSTFHFTLPFAHSNGRQPEATPPATPAGDAPRLQVLVAEDNRVNQIFITDYLEEQGHDVDVAANGRQALDMLAQAPFDLVLMDVGMPEMDGIEATQRIRDGHDGVRNPDIPIVAFTAHALKGDRQRCLDAGMDDYLSKPVDVARLEAILQRLFSD